MTSLADIGVTLVFGLYFGGIVYLVAIGMSMIFDVLGFINLTHAVFAAVGALSMVSLVDLVGIIDRTLLFFLLLPVVVGLVILLGLVLQRTLFAPLIETEETYQLLGSFGLLFVSLDVMEVVWGSRPLLFARPNPLGTLGAVSLFGRSVELYYLVVIALSVAMATAIYLAFRRTRLGKLTRAVADNEAMAGMLGVNVGRVRLVVLSVGVGLAGLGGALLVPVTSASAELAVNYVLLAFAAMVIGGTGSLRGVFVASLFIGAVRAVGIAYVPGLQMPVIFLAMAVVLLVRPAGIFGGTTA